MNDQSNESTNKQIIIESKTSNSSNTGNKNKMKKQPVMRKVVHKNKWNFEPSDFSFDNQIQNIRKIIKFASYLRLIDKLA